MGDYPKSAGYYPEGAKNYPKDYPKNIRDYPKSVCYYPENAKNYPKDYPESIRDYSKVPDTTQKTTQKAPETTQITKGLSKFQHRILIELLKEPSLSRKELTKIIADVSEDGIKYNLKRLQQMGYIERVGANRGGYWRVLIQMQSVNN